MMLAVRLGCNTKPILIRVIRVIRGYTCLPAHCPRHRNRACPARPFCVLVPFVTASLSPSPLERLLIILDALCAAIAARGPGWVLTAPLLFLLWRRLRRIATRAKQVAARLATGAPLPVPRSRAATCRPPRPQPLRLPGGYAWLVRLIPATAGYGSQLHYLLTDPEAAPLLASPSLRRMLNPVCRMLGIPAPPRPKPPPSPRPAAVPPMPAAADRASDPGETVRDPPPAAKPLAA
jgi:hypothetical protein